MLSLSPAVRIFVHALPTDMRKHFDGLSSLVTHSFGMDVLGGDYFVFLNRARNRCKILLWIVTASWFGRNDWNAVVFNFQAVGTRLHWPSKWIL